MIIIIVSLAIIVIAICILNYLRMRYLEKILKDIHDKESQRNIIYKKMLDEYVKMLSAMNLNNHCYNSINDEYTAMNNTFKELTERVDKIDKQYMTLSKKIDKLLPAEIRIDTSCNMKCVDKGVLQK